MIYKAKEHIYCGQYVRITGADVTRWPQDGRHPDAIAMDDFPQGSLIAKSGNLLIRPRPTTIVGRLRSGERAENSVEFGG